jgi:uncharacterized BrkB/YihY/UPF0761 family membrane protein
MANNNNLTKAQQEIIQRQRIRSLVLLVIVAALVWGLVSSLNLLLVSVVQKIFPNKGKLAYGIIQSVIYLIFLFMIIYFLNVDISISQSTVNIN